MDLSYKNLNVKYWYSLDYLMRWYVSEPPIIISGFWRSGTTWIQQVMAELISAKTQFEPLEPSALFPLHKYPTFDSIQGAYIPLAADVFSKKDWNYLDLAFKGVSPKRSGFNYLARTTVKECLADRVLIKFVRAQFILPDLVQRYKPQGVVHISRHPMAVAQSLIRAKWQWDFADINFTEIYWREIKSSKCHLWNELAPYDHAAKAEKIAALWALSEREIRKSENVTFVKYEDLLKNPDIEFASLIAGLKLKIVNVVDYTQDSPVTSADRVGINMDDRLNSWRKEMPLETQAKIRTVLLDIWPEVENEWSLF